MFCPECGHKLDDGAVFCPNCGAKVPGVWDEKPDHTEEEPADAGSFDFNDKKDSAGGGNSGGPDKKLMTAIIAVAAAVVCVLVVLIVKPGLPGIGKKEETASVSGANTTSVQTASDSSVKSVSEKKSDGVKKASVTATPAPSGTAAPSSSGTGALTGTPAPAASAQSADENGIHRYEVVTADVSWDQAWSDALQKGGYLCRISSEEEYQAVVNAINSSNTRATNIFLGGRDDVNQVYHWLNRDGTFMQGDVATDAWAVSHWYPGEPSHQDTADGKTIVEDRIDLIKVKNVWYLNDTTSDPIEAYPGTLSGKIGYVIEYDS
jgi:uncharacterized Zn finger protein (UPF0148 family)